MWARADAAMTVTTLHGEAYRPRGAHADPNAKQPSKRDSSAAPPRAILLPGLVAFGVNLQPRPGKTWVHSPRPATVPWKVVRTQPPASSVAGSRTLSSPPVPLAC